VTPIFRTGWVLGIACWAVGLVPSPARGDEELEFFEKRVRPVLVERCHKCHAAEQQKGGLRLDSREAALAGGDSGPALVPGQVEESLLVSAIGYDPDSYQMPPTGKLPEEEIAVLTEWVARGAHWPAEAAVARSSGVTTEEVLARAATHWSFQPMRAASPPEVKDGGWCRGPIDRFVWAGMEGAGLKPASAADRYALLRRVTYDLIGLPPTRAEIDAFVQDTSDEAFARVVERLLASPHYGERWGRHWLDLARYSETAGHEFDYDLPDAYRYRDYVVRAFQDDLPFDQFVVEQIAGDLVQPPRRHPTEGTNESILGTGLFWLGESIHSPVDVTEEQAKRVDNQIDVLAKTFLGLTVSCARCHDHKFDPISAQDYYALAGIIKSTRYEHASLELPENTEPALAQVREQADRWNASQWGALRGRWHGELAALAGDLKRWASRDAGEGAGEEAWRESMRARLAVWAAQVEHPLHAFAKLSEAGSAEEFAQRKAELLTPQSAGEVLADFDPVEQVAWQAEGLAFGGDVNRVMRVGRTESGSLMLTGPGVASSRTPSETLQGAWRSPDFIIGQPKLAYRLRGRGVRVRVIVDGFHRIQEPIYGVLQFEVNNPDAWGWHVQDVSMWQGQRAYIEVLDEGGGWIELDEIRAGEGAPAAGWHPLVRAMLEGAECKSTESLAARYGALFEQLMKTTDPASAVHDRDAGDLLERLILGGCLSAPTREELPQPAPEEVAEQQKLITALAAPRKGLVAAEGTPTDDRVQIRGNHKQLGPAVARRPLTALAGDVESPTSGSGRWELAQHLIDPEHPLVPRVLVNRVWQHHFGSGLVGSPDDFGRMGQTPTHPELLDYLARDFVAHGWSIKRLHRQMLLSATYQQASQASALGAQVDPQNRLLSHFSPQRLEAEAIRDALLTVSGRLDRTLYGPSVAPHLTPFMQGRGRPTTSGPLDGNGRRSLYINVRRNFLTPLFLAFDYPQPFSTMGRRTSSNVPAQALAMLNNPLVWEQAKLWGQRVVNQEGTDEERVRGMYLDALTRLPEAEELATALAFVRESRERTTPAVVVNQGSGPDGTALATAGELEAWTGLAHAMFNLKEFLYVR
jgi:hypothetical protein